MKDLVLVLFRILTRKEQTRLFVLAGFDLLIGVADIAFLIAMLLLIQVYTTHTLPIALLKYNHLLFKYNPVMVTGVFLLLFIIKSVIGVLVSKKQSHFVFGVSSRLSAEHINSYFKDAYSSFVNVDSSQRIRHISQVPIEFGTYILTNFQQIIAQSILIVFTVTAILWYHPGLFVLLLLLLVPPVVLLGCIVKQQLKTVRTQIKTNSVKVIQYLQEALSSYVESNIYGKHSFFTGRYNRYQQQMNENIATLQTLQGLSSRFFEVFALLGFFILIILNQFYGDNNTINLLTIGVFMAAAYKIIPGMVKILNSAGQIKTYSFLIDELTESIVNETNIINSDDAVPSIKSIQFRKVYFNYNDNLVLDGVSFEIKRGDIIGLSGSSGRGKTTIINLLLGFLQQDTGLIIINNKLLAAAERKQYWPAIAYVKQQGFFINDTILKNITLGDGDYDKTRLTQALNISGLNTLLENEVDGLHKMIFEHGKNISGGQRQRLSLARALYHDFDLLILDEPFSELDEEAEHELLFRLKSFAQDKMILLITHNRASLAFCNKIISPYAVQI